MRKTIQWTHADGKTVEYIGIKALAKALGVTQGTAQKYLRKGIYSDADLPKPGRHTKKRDENATVRKRHRSTSVDKHYSDFIADMETWE